ncbi:MAG: RNA polymerase sigma factor SigY [Clostridia bacterium]|nr:RNA polymerase sigma factor SigY [Clostridia bacterium]
MGELQLIEAAKKGNKSALNTLLTDNYKLVAGYVIKMTGDPERAQDIVQETLLRAVLNIDKFTPNAKFSTWLIKIATNVYRDELRKNKNLEPLNETLESPGQGPEELIIIRDEYHEVLDILLGLPYEKRAVFILKHFYGLKYEEIADVLQCPVGTVRSRLHNCIKSIMSDMERRKLI